MRYQDYDEYELTPQRRPQRPRRQHRKGAEYYGWLQNLGLDIETKRDVDLNYEHGENQAHYKGRRNKKAQGEIGMQWDR